MNKQISLRNIRKLRGLTQQKVADELGVSRYTYIKIEHNPSRASILQARRLCEILRCSYEEIFFTVDAS